MKIIDAYVVDPTTVGIHKRPYLTVVVDEQPDVTIEPRDFSGGWTVAKYGPFTKYEVDPDLTNLQRPEYIHPNITGLAADFNLRFRGQFPVIVDIDLLIRGNGEVRRASGMSLNLSRARQLLRKYDRDWNIYLVDKDATEIIMEWTPVNKSAGCRWWLGETICGRFPTRPVRIDGVDLPVCNEHMEAFKAKKAAESSAAKAAS